MVEDEDGNNAAMLIQLQPLLVFLVPPGRASLCPISQSPSSSLVSSSLGTFFTAADIQFQAPIGHRSRPNSNQIGPLGTGK